MFGFGKSKKKKSADKSTTGEKRLANGLSKTSGSLFGNLFFGKKKISDELFEELESRLLMSDVGLELTTEILTEIRNNLKRKELSDIDSLVSELKSLMLKLLEPVEKPLILPENELYVILIVGVNGAGKTTTIGKIAHKFKQQGKSVMLAAGDTFRAAAIEQLQEWGVRNSIPVIAQNTGADSASVIFDAIASAKAKNIDVLIADTAGRLHTQDNLMQELGKVNKVIKKHDVNYPQEIMLVLDASIGQNALNQAKKFDELLDLSSLTITKMDGTAKGGMMFALANQINLPIRFLGVGESIDDLQQFSANDFVDAITNKIQG